MTPPGPKILIVDDQPALLKMMGLYLTRVGFRVTLLDSTEKAWAEAQDHIGELAGAVLDATLRGLSTQDLALRLLAGNPGMCIVVASGYPVDMTALEAVAGGRVAFVQKPF